MQPLNKKDARAAASAAKAYSKSQKNWFLRHKILSSVGALVVLVVIISVAASAGGSGNNTASNTAGSSSAGVQAAATRSSTAQAAATKPSSALKADAGGGQPPIQDGDWRLDSVRVKSDGFGGFDATARVTYTGSDTNGGSNLFTLTLFKGGTDIAALDGAANDVKPGKTVSVQLIGTDKYVAGPYTYDFQNNI